MVLVQYICVNLGNTQRLLDCFGKEPKIENFDKFKT